VGSPHKTIRREGIVTVVTAIRLVQVPVDTSKSYFFVVTKAKWVAHCKTGVSRCSTTCAIP
jgi:hypothetical protein